jgi:gas vesicle protein
MDAQQATMALQQGGFLSPPPTITPQQAQAALKMMPAQAPATAGIQPSQSSFTDNIKEALLGAPANIADALANTTRNALNTGVNLINGATSAAGIPAIPNIPQGESFRDMAGLPQANMADKLVQGITSVVPYSAGLGELGAVGNASTLASRVGTGAAEGALYGGTQNPDAPLNGAVLGGVLGTAAPLVSSGAQAIGKSAANLYAKSALPGLISKGTDVLKSSLGNASDYAQQLQNIYQNVAQNAKDLMSQRYGLAKNLDSQYQDNVSAWGQQPAQQAELANQLQNSKSILYSGGLKKNAIDSYTDDLLNGNIKPDEDILGKFDNSAFVNSLQGIKADLEDKIGQETGTLYDNSLSHVNKWLDSPPTTWQQAIQRAQNINDAPKTYALQNNNAQDDFLRGVVGQARNALKESVYQSSANAPGSGIGGLWNAANEAYAKKMGYLQVPDASGNALQFSKGAANAMESPASPDASILDNYLPSGKQTGVMGITHLGNLYGDQGTANNALLSYGLRNLNNADKDPMQAMNFYKGLSPQQSNVLYANNPSQPYFSTAAQGIQKYGTPKMAPDAMLPLIGHHIGRASPLAATGFVGGLIAGLPWEDAMLLGLGAAATGRVGAYGAQKIATPQNVQRAMNYGKTPISTGLLGGVRGYLAPALLAQGATQ